MAETMLTTVDNPWSPFTNFDEWDTWDRAHGYYTLGLLARVARSSDELSQADQDTITDQAIDEIVRENVCGMYIKVTPDRYSS